MRLQHFDFIIFFSTDKHLNLEYEVAILKRKGRKGIPCIELSYPPLPFAYGWPQKFYYIYTTTLSRLLILMPLIVIY